MWRIQEAYLYSAELCREKKIQWFFEFHVIFKVNNLYSVKIGMFISTQWLLTSLNQKCITDHVLKTSCSYHVESSVLHSFTIRRKNISFYLKGHKETLNTLNNSNNLRYYPQRKYEKPLLSPLLLTSECEKLSASLISKSKIRRKKNRKNENIPIEH